MNGLIIHSLCPFRTQSVRRTSLREKILTTKKDAVEEARLRLRAQEVSKLSSSKLSDSIRNTLYTMLNEREVLFAGEGAENVGSEVVICC